MKSKSLASVSISSWERCAMDQAKNNCSKSWRRRVLWHRCRQRHRPCSILARCSMRRGRAWDMRLQGPLLLVNRQTTLPPKPSHRLNHRWLNWQVQDRFWKSQLRDLQAGNKLNHTYVPSTVEIKRASMEARVSHSSNRLWPYKVHAVWVMVTASQLKFYRYSLRLSQEVLNMWSPTWMIISIL